jgi:hypothetical protein
MSFFFIVGAMPDAKASPKVVGKAEIPGRQKVGLQDRDCLHALQGKSAASLPVRIVADGIPPPIGIGQVKRAKFPRLPFFAVDFAVIEAKLPAFENGSGQFLEQADIGRHNPGALQRKCLIEVRPAERNLRLEGTRKSLKTIA